MGWAKGQSGNPKGRPTDAIRTRAIRKRILNAAPEIVDALIVAAKAGDSAAGKALLACSCPPLKAIELPVALSLSADADLADQGRAVITALASGQIPPGQAASILQALAGVARLVEITEIERRLAALEVKRADSKETPCNTEP